MEIRTNYLDLYSPEEWEKIIEDYEKSGLSGFAYSKKKRIPVSTFYGWRNKLRPSSCKHSKQTKIKWIQIMEDWKKSGLVSYIYCKEKKISFVGFYKWHSKLFPSLPRDHHNVRERWKQRIEDWQKSELSKKVYCQEKELNPNIFSKWQRKLNLNVLPQKTPKEKWIEIIKDWQKSGLKKGLYCRKKKLDRSSFSSWEKKLNSCMELNPLLDNEKGGSQTELPLQESFMSLTPSSANSDESSHPTPKIELMLPRGHHLTLEGSFDREKLNLWLAFLLQGKI